MRISFGTGRGSRSKIGRIAATTALALMICSVAAGPVFAKDHGDDRGHHDDHDRGWHGRGGYVAPGPDYYYAPPEPDYYYAPEPDYYYPPEPEPGYYPPPPPEGINLFFGIH